MRKADKIYLLGFMGSGKSTVGKNLAAALNWSFIDLDEQIEKHSGMKIQAIFSEKGESWFRNLETEILLKTRNYTETVISTGGGTPCFADNMDFMLENGVTLYLKMTPENIENRLADSPDERPLIKNIDKKDLLKFIRAKLAERKKWYERSELIIDGFSVETASLCYLIQDWIRN